MADQPTLFALPPAEIRLLSVEQQLERLVEIQRQDGLLTRRQAAEFLRINEASVRDLIKRGRISEVQAMGSAYVLASEVLAYSSQRGSNAGGRGKKAGIARRAA